MQVATINGETRTQRSRSALRNLRNRGLVPAIVYGHKETPEMLALSAHDLDLALEKMAHVVKVKLGAREEQYLLKDVQYDHMQATPMHVDLMRADLTERLTVRVPIELRGEPHGIHEGGVLVQIADSLEVECCLLDIPESIRPNVSHLGLNEALQVKDIDLPDGVTATGKPDEIIATVTAKRGVTEEEAAASEEGVEGAPAEPELIGRKAKDEEGDSEG